ncbi:T9SS type A sorting domain-containing protein [Aureitalea sp. L0-47]|uniref:T9SS type A sorting domain-containing protein n=1 Tax=Aureitalea sp. L0-47 TaxID=2816962 RepID=UPI002237E654|nr:T9SS type A sorting domain-containing protein [Aureitalea sp. L0-47]MCW5520750.1 T9SS type A sorting domain-containing protein [Aureitalea sp. L0-47]
MKNLLLFSVALVMSLNAMAQLYVTPNASSSTDSYVYVSDEVLFVEQDVNLVANTNDPNTEASIYLRDEAQLIQGATASANSGTGFISVYQDSNSDSYDYNFWSSPVGNPNAGSGNRNFGILNVYDANTVTDSDQTNVTAAYNGTPSPNLTISRRWLYKRPAGGGYQAIWTNYSVPAGLGFTMKGVGVTPAGGDPWVDPMNQLYDFRGRPHNGDIVVNTLANESVLSGNPYPSALDLNLVFNDPDNIEINEFRFWDEDRSINSHYFVDNKGGYGTWIPGPSPYATGGAYAAPTFLNYDNGGNPIGATMDSGEALNRLYSPIGQGFNIFTDIAGDGQIVLKNSHRVFYRESGSLSVFRSPQGAGTGTSTIGNPENGDPSTISSEVDPFAEYPPTLRFYTVFGESHLRDMLLMLSDTSTDGYDRGLDARHPMDGKNAEAYFPIGDDKDFLPYVIQTVPYSVGKKIPLNFVIDQATPVTIMATEEINLPSKVVLWDSEGNTWQEITNGNQAELQLHEGTYENRFFLVFRGGPDPVIDPSTISVNNRSAQVNNNVDFFQNNPASQLEVANPEGFVIKSASIFDMSGKLVLNQRDLGDSTSFTFSTATFSDGVYIVKLVTEDDITIDYRMTVHNRR